MIINATVISNTGKIVLIAHKKDQLYGVLETRSPRYLMNWEVETDIAELEIRAVAQKVLA